MGVTLVLGAAGLLGHRLVRALAEAGRPAVGAIRGRHASRARDYLARFGQIEVLDDARDAAAVRTLLARGVDTLVNCVAVPPRAASPLDLIETNAALPQRLAALCDATGTKLIQIGTDAVFDGTGGPYDERAAPSPVTPYGCAKLLGEVTHGRHLTLRTSMYGRELVGQRGLVEWLVSSRGRVNGYRRVVFSGPSADALARFIVDQAIEHDLTGLLHVGAAPVSKYDLLVLLVRALRLPVEVVPVDDPAGSWVLRSVRGSECDLRFPTHTEMVDELAAGSRT